MKKFGLNFLVLIFAIPTITLCAQTVDRPKPWFSLSIEEEKLPESYPASMHEVLVKYTNISDAIQKDACMNAPWVYNVVVLRDGVLVGKRKGKSENSGETHDPREIKVPFTGAVTCGAMKQIPPQRSITFPLWVSSDDYDMTEPGTYTITVKRETFPYEPAKSVTVWSNTIEIVVPQPGAETPQ